MPANAIFQNLESLVEGLRHLADDAFETENFPVAKQAADALESSMRLAGDKAGLDVYDDGFEGNFKKIADLATLVQSVQDLEVAVEGTPLEAHMPAIKGAVGSLVETVSELTNGIDISNPLSIGQSEPEAAASLNVTDSPDNVTDSPDVVASIDPKVGGPGFGGMAA